LNKILQLPKVLVRTLARRFREVHLASSRPGGRLWLKRRSARTVFSLSRFATFALALCGCFGLSGCKQENKLIAPAPPKIGVAQPVRQSVTPYLEATGNTVAYNEVDLVARVDGFLNAINYKDGAEAKRGDTLFVIEPAPYEAKYQQAQASLASTQAQLVQAEAEYNRQSTLGQRDFASQSAVDQARAKRDQLRADLTNQQAGLTLAGINLGYTRVAAPFDGVVTAHLASVGELVGVSSPTKLASIVELDPIYVTFAVSEQDVLRIRASLAKRGLTVRDLKQVPIEVGLMSEEGYPHKGTLDYTDPQVSTATGTLQVRGIFPNAERVLLPGYFVRIRLPVDQPQTALLIPERAIGADQAGRYVLVLNGDNVVEQRSVQPGQTVGSLRVIDHGLTAEDRVVVTNLQRAIPGTKAAPESTTITAASLPPSGAESAQ
jgi:multidrug efflux system membrane fusion protein